MKKLLLGLIFLAAFLPLSIMAQQAQEFGEYTVHYNALNSSLISPEIATAYNIRRSSSRGLINISVLKTGDDGVATAVAATVITTGRNLTGQTRTVKMREINEGEGAVYYIGELSVRNMETFDFTVVVTPIDLNKPLTVKFRQQFYTE